MRGPQFRQEYFYRRGLVLGFTMAEIFALLIFCLLLTVWWMLSKKDDEARALEERLKTGKEKVAALEREVSHLRERDKEFLVLQEKLKILAGKDGSGKNKFDDLFQELVVERRRSEYAESRVVALTEEVSRSKEIVESLREAGIDTQDLNGLKEIVAMTEVVAAALEGAKIDLSKRQGVAEATDRIVKIVDEYNALGRQVSNLKGQLINIQKRCEGLGRGTEVPPCWADGSGKAEYIFDIALTSNGLIVHDRKLPNRSEEQAKLPLTGVTMDKEITPAQFLREYKPLRKWSDERNCRFFVQAFDKTKENEKKLYKDRMRAVEECFYKYEVRDKPYPWDLPDRLDQTPRTAAKKLETSYE